MRIHTIKNFINKFVVFFSENSANYWHSVTKCQITEKPIEIGKYYLDFSSKADYPGRFTADGIPLYSHFGQAEILHPVVVCQYAFGLHEMFARSNFLDERFKIKFLRQADWLVENCIDSIGTGKVWHLMYNIGEYGLDSPWISALVQGEAISVLTRAYAITSDTKYISLAESALIPFEFSVAKGGLVNKFEGNIIYEEYPSLIKTVGVLNGFIFSLFGIYDIILIRNSEKAENLFNEGKESLKELLKFYDINNWTNYYLFDYPKCYYSSFTYHRIVTEQLKALFILTGEELFKEYYIKWLGYGDKLLNRLRAMGNKFLFNHKLTA